MPSKNVRTLIYLGISLLIFLGIIYFFWVRPNGQLNETKGLLTTKEFLELKNSVRTGLAQAIGGAVLLLGLFFTWRNIRATERNLEITQENIRAAQDSAARNLAIAQEGQITDRFTKAIEQLGNKDSIAVRLGGIYALERIAKDSERDHWPIMEILTAYVRENAPWREEEGPVSHDVEKVKDTLKPPPADIQSILDVISRRTRSYEKSDQHIYLFRTNLRRCLLHNANLEKAYLAQVHLEWSYLNGANFEGAFLHLAHLEEAFLREANLKNADLTNAYLKGAKLIYAEFNGATLQGCHLEGTSLTYAKGLTQDQINSAYTDEKTELPSGLKIPEKE